MKKRYWLAIGLLVAAGGAVVGLPKLVSVEKAQHLLVTKVREQTGRELVIAGPAEVRIWPDLAVHVEQVRLSSPEGFGHEPMLEVPELDVEVAILPLLKRQLVLHGFVMHQPVIRLMKDAKGRPNWGFQSRDMQAVEQVTEDTPASDRQKVNAMSRLQAWELGTLRIEDATLLYQDQQSGTDERLEKVNITLDAPRLTQAVGLDANARWRGQEVVFNVRSDSPLPLLQGEPLPMEITLKAAKAAATVSGELTLPQAQAQSWQWQGSMTARIPDVPLLVQWMQGGETPPASLPTQVEMQAHVMLDAAGAKATDMKLSSEHLQATGVISTGWTEERPKLVADVQIPVLDLDVWTPSDAKKTVQEQSQSEMPLVSTAHAKEPVVMPSAPWDNQPIDISGLRLLDAEIQAVIGSLSYQGLQARNAPVKAMLEGGVLEVKLPGWGVAEGTVDTTLQMDAARLVPTWSLNSRWQQVQVAPLLQALGQSDRLSGKGNVVLDVHSKGRSLQQWMEQMQGRTALHLRDGALKGMDLAMVVRSVKSAMGSDVDVSRRQTDFSELSADFQFIRPGVAHTKNLTLLAPFARLTGEGDIYLDRKELRFDITPRAVGSSKGQGGEINAKGLYVPFVVKGSFDQVAFYPKMGDLVKEGLKNPESVEVLKDNANKIKEGLQDIFRGL